MSPAVMRKSDLPNGEATQFKPGMCGNSSDRGAHRRKMRPARIPHHGRVDGSSGPDSLMSQSNARADPITAAPITASDGGLCVLPIRTVSALGLPNYAFAKQDIDVVGAWSSARPGAS